MILMIKIEGYVENIVFKNQETLFCVMEINHNDSLLTVVGNMANIMEGEDLILYGEFSSHQKFGHQFKVKAFESKLPSSAYAIKKYLSSGIVKGIGPTIAARIVETFGDNCLEFIRENPEKLAEIKGISPKKIDSIIQEFNDIFGIKSTMEFFSKYGVSPNLSVDIYNIFGNKAIELVKKNPYIICKDSINLNFEIADNIGSSLNFKKDDYNRISSALEYVLKKNLTNGHTCLPKETLIEVTSRLLSIDQSKIIDILQDKILREELIEILKNREYIYLKKMYECEIYISKRIISLASREKGTISNIDILIDLIEQENKIIYDETQKEAIYASINNHIMVLTGRPGTGKTTTLNAIISLLEQQGLKLYLVAPTGRAAKILANMTKREAKTIHRLLEAVFNQDSSLVFSRNEKNLLDCDAIIIDEVSMIDTALFDALLKALPTSTKIIIVGDSDQLPSVGAGNILKDIIDSGRVPTIELTKIFRQAKKSLIITNAHAIVNGNMPDISVKDNDFFYINSKNSESCSNLIIELCSKRLPNFYKFSPIDDIQILCPSKKGKVGTIELNKNLQEVLNPKSPEKKECSSTNYNFRENDKVMQIKNNYNIEWEKNSEKGLGIFNGDIGIIKEINLKNNIIVIDFEQRIVNYALDNLKDLELAYAITIHKSQGSEFNAVIVPIIDGFDKLHYRNLLYTAVTRAKKLLIIVGSKGRIKFMVDNNKKMLRYTGLSFFLENQSNE